ncbi:MAG: hypothetical protein R2698_08295 [Microthrixaceae bacterium]
MEIDDCDPTCVGGHKRYYTVLVTASGIDVGEASARYTRLRIDFTGAVPPGRERSEVLDLPPHPDHAGDTAS